MSVDMPGKYCMFDVAVLFTLPNNWTELLNCFWSGPTSDKSLGTLLILSLNKTILAVLLSSFVGKAGDGMLKGLGVGTTVSCCG